MLWFAMVRNGSLCLGSPALPCPATCTRSPVLCCAGCSASCTAGVHHPAPSAAAVQCAGHAVCKRGAFTRTCSDGRLHGAPRRTGAGAGTGACRDTCPAVFRCASPKCAPHGLAQVSRYSACGTGHPRLGRVMAWAAISSRPQGLLLAVPAVSSRHHHSHTQRQACAGPCTAGQGRAQSGQPVGSAAQRLAWRWRCMQQAVFEMRLYRFTPGTDGVAKWTSACSAGYAPHRPPTGCRP